MEGIQKILVLLNYSKKYNKKEHIIYFCNPKLHTIFLSYIYGGNLKAGTLNSNHANTGHLLLRKDVNHKITSKNNKI